MTVLDLFAGIGGWTIACHRVGLPTMAACEIDEFKRSVYGHHFPGVPIYSDIRDLTATRLLADTGRLPTWIVGSPPCQDASTANAKGRGVDGERTGLFFEATRLIAECRPVVVVLENVPGLRTRGADRVFADLEELGYALTPVVVGAHRVGAPHKRERVWIVGRLLADPNEDQGGAGAPGRLGPGGQGQPQPLWSLQDAPDAEQGGRKGGHQEEPGGSPGATVPCGAPGNRPGRWGSPVEALSAAHAAALRDDDGLPREVVRRGIMAYGDAIVPEVAERVLSAILHAEKSA